MAFSMTGRQKETGNVDIFMKERKTWEKKKNRAEHADLERLQQEA